MVFERENTARAGIILVPTLIAGIDGMNVRVVPELHWGLGYPLSLGLMGGPVAGLNALFMRKGWL